MVQNTSQPWIYEQDITTSHWTSHQYSKQPSLCHLENMNTSKYLSDLHKHLHIFRSLMTSVLKDFPFTIAYLDDIIIFGRKQRTPIPHQTSFQKIMKCSLIHETQQMPLLCQRDPVPWSHPQHHRHQTTTIENSSHQQHAPT